MKDPGRLSCCVFDLDGTLTDTWPVSLDAFRGAIENFAERRFSDDELKSLAGPSEDGILQQLFPDQWEVCFANYLTAFQNQLHGRDIVFPLVRDLLDTIRACDIPMTVNSGKVQECVEIALSHAGIDHYFLEVQGGSADGDRKAERLADLIRRKGLHGTQVAYIGDTPGDMLAARKSGTRGIGATWNSGTNASELSAAGADLVFSDVASLIDWIRR